MPFALTPAALIGACIIGSLAAYLSYRRGKNPYLWFFIGFFFGLLGIMAIFFAPFSKKKLPPAPAQAVPVFSIPGPTDKFWYYLDSSRQQQGPMSHHALVSAWKKGSVTLSTLVWNEELPEWKPLQELVVKS